MLESVGFLSERDIDLLTLGKPGFSSYSSYLESDLWDTIRRAILHRDECRCTSLKCLSKYKDKITKQVHHLGYSRAVLLGISTPSLVTLCKRCHEDIEFDALGKKLTYKEAFGRTLLVVAGLRQRISKTKSVANNPAIGKWFRTRWDSDKHRNTARAIYVKLEPKWKTLILKELYQGKLPKSLGPWLDLESELKQMCALKGKTYFPFEPNRKVKPLKYIITSAQIKELSRLRKG